MHLSSLVALLLVACLAASFASLPFEGGRTARVGQGLEASALPVHPMDANLSLTIASNVSAVDPGDSILFYGTARNLGNATATNVTLEAPLDLNSTYLQSFPNATYDSMNRTLRWTVASIAVGGWANTAWTIRVAAGMPDNSTILARFRVTYANATGVPQPPKEVLATVRVRAPVFNPQLRPVVAAAEHGDAVVVKLHVNNTGSGTARQAWSNWTLGGHFRFEYLEEPVPVTNVTDGFRANLSNLAPGPHALTAHLVVLRGLDDGLSMGIQSTWTATDKNGNRLLPSTAGNAVVLWAPRLTLGMNASAVRVNATSRFILTLTIRNTGHASGIGWLNTTLPSGPTFISDNGSFPRTKVSKRYTWTLPAVSPGGAIVLGITLEAAQTSGVASFVFTLDFTDGKGSLPVRVSGPRIDVESVGLPATPSSPGSADWLPWTIGAAAVGTLASFVIWRRRRASNLQIEDVFVADMAGHLLAHRSSGLVAYEDEDILVGMFKVIQDFVKDSFAKGTDDTMKSMEFGERKIIIERGGYHFISVVYRGLDHGALSERVKKVSRLIDQKFGQALENWSGDLDELRGLATLLPQVWKHQPRSRGSPRQPSAPSGAGGPPPGVTTGPTDGRPAESGDPGVAVETPK